MSSEMHSYEAPGFKTPSWRSEEWLRRYNAEPGFNRDANDDRRVVPIPTFRRPFPDLESLVGSYDLFFQYTPDDYPHGNAAEHHMMSGTLDLELDSSGVLVGTTDMYFHTFAFVIGDAGDLEFTCRSDGQLRVTNRDEWDEDFQRNVWEAPVGTISVVDRPMAVKYMPSVWWCEQPHTN